MVVVQWHLQVWWWCSGTYGYGGVVYLSHPPRSRELMQLHSTRHLLADVVSSVRVKSAHPIKLVITRVRHELVSTRVTHELVSTRVRHELVSTRVRHEKIIIATPN